MALITDAFIKRLLRIFFKLTCHDKGSSLCFVQSPSPPLPAEAVFFLSNRKVKSQKKNFFFFLKRRGNY